MKIKRQWLIFVMGLSLVVAIETIIAATLAPEPKIPPGYQPQEAETEKGLWLELSEYEVAIRQSALLVKNRAINDYVRKAACIVAGDYCNDIRVYVIRNPNFNASMTANGVMQVWTGLLVRVSSEDELAAVLGHELAHYTQLHTLARVRAIRKKMASASIIDLFIGLPLGQLSALSSLMSFSREQEEEADLLGVRFMAESGYDPSAAARVWEMIVAEEESAFAKSEEPGMFSKTHPGAADRIVTLKNFVDEFYSEVTPTPESRQRHVDILNQFYPMLMEDQLDTNRFGRTHHLLKTHREIGVETGLIDFFTGEMYRQRKAEGDLELAQKSYQLAVKSKNPIAEAYRNLGYIKLKQKQPAQAAEDFRRYLELKPNANDRAMIEFYLEE